MTYLRPYVNTMLKKHSYGDKFKDIRFLARHVEAYEPAIPDPHEEEQTNTQKSYIPH